MFYFYNYFTELFKVKYNLSQFQFLFYCFLQTKYILHFCIIKKAGIRNIE